MAMTALRGGGATSPGRHQRRRGGLARRLNGTERRYECLVRVFPHAPTSLLVEAAGRLRRTRYRRGDVIVAEGEPADWFYIMTSGEADLIQRVEDRDVYVCTFAPGQFFGEVGLLTSSPRNATVRAVSEVEVLSLDRDTFRRMADHSQTADDLAHVVQVRSVRPVPRDDGAPCPRGRG